MQVPSLPPCNPTPEPSYEREMAERKQFPGIAATAFVSNTDRMALEALKRVPLLPKLIQKFHEVGVDRWLYCYNMAMAVR